MNSLTRIAENRRRWTWSGIGFAALALCLPATTLAAVEMPGLFSDHMVLQRDMPVPIWGKADPGEKVRVVVWANAKIEGDSVLVWSDKAPDPKAVRYAWADAPFWANLFNKDGLPGLIFRTDEFE